VGDISSFSCYAVEGMGPLGEIHPWISAPGEEIISAFNHYVNRSSTDDVVVNQGDYLYGKMSGTSMCTPMVAGIVALWMQAATECGKQLSLSEVKQIMKETAIRDEWVTSGPNATHFGNGKIDALAGIKYILEQYGGHTYDVGDVNHDGKVNIADVTRLIDYLLDSETTEVCPICADVAENGIINIADVTALIDRLLSDN
jgi:subtilisin family serine protease